MFQSLTGAIQTGYIFSHFSTLSLCFNPSQVRFKPGDTFELIGQLTEFQSLTGAIQTYLILFRDKYKERCFNPSQVRFKPLTI